MRPQALGRRAKRMLAHADMQPAERAAVETAINDPVLLRKWCNRINDTCPPPDDIPEYVLYCGGGAFVDKLWDWFKENWPTILKLLLTLLL